MLKWHSLFHDQRRSRSILRRTEISKAQHTPGPWKVSGKEVIIPTRLKQRFFTESIEDARLIAAAPDEHEANEFTVSELEYYIGNPSAWEYYDDEMSERLRRVVEKARAAIAKAKGE